MDDAGRRPYIGRVNLLLLLSALLSALTSVGVGTRTPQIPAVVVSRSVETAVAVQASPVRVSHQAFVTVPPLKVAQPLAWQLLPAVPLYLSRRRE